MSGPGPFRQVVGFGCRVGRRRSLMCQWRKGSRLQSFRRPLTQLCERAPSLNTGENASSATPSAIDVNAVGVRRTWLFHPGWGSSLTA